MPVTPPLSRGTRAASQGQRATARACVLIQCASGTRGEVPAGAERFDSLDLQREWGICRMRILILAPRGLASEGLGSVVNAQYRRDDVFLIHVRNATSAQLERAISDCQPDQLFFAEHTEDAGIKLVALSRRHAASDDASAASAVSAAAVSSEPNPLPAERLAELAADILRHLPTPDPSDPDGQPTRAAMRRMLERLIPQPADFDRFVETRLPAVWIRLSPGMNRVARTNELLSVMPTRKILPLLADFHEYEPLRKGLSYELYYSERWMPSYGATS